VFRELHGEFKDFVTSLSTKTNPLSYTDLHSYLLTHEFFHKSLLQSIESSVITLLLPTSAQPPLAFVAQGQFSSSHGQSFDSHNNSYNSYHGRGRFHGGWRNNNINFNNDTTFTVGIMVLTIGFSNNIINSKEIVPFHQISGLIHDLLGANLAILLVSRLNSVPNSTITSYKIMST
jgi:hypothetical protein